MFAALAQDGAEQAGSKMAVASLLKMMWGQQYVDERDARFINDRVHANIQRDGTFSVVPQVPGGVTTPAQLRRIADVAERYNVPMLKIAGGQRIDLRRVRKEDLPMVWADLDMPSGHAYAKSFRTVKTCVGSDFCRFGLGDSTHLGIGIEQRYHGLESPAKMKLAVSGCPRNCAESYVKDVGIVRSRAAGGRSTLVVQPARPCARATCSPPWTATTTPSCSPGGSCSTTGRTPSGWNAATTSYPGSGWPSCRRSSSMTWTGSRAVR
ncbi:MAG: hypothetical protein ACRDRR_24720 [Pseudonocardiaceae bacterium]